MILRVAFLLATLPIGIFPADKKVEVLPDVPIQQLGCNAVKSTLPDGISWWHIRVWFLSDGERYSRLYAIRSGDELSKALKDCDFWLKNANQQLLKRLTKKMAANEVR